MQNLVEGLRKIRGNVDERLRQNQTVQQAIAGTLDKKTYVNYLQRIANAYAPHSPRVMCLAAARCSDNQRDLAGYFIKHGLEESGHDLWASEDLRHLVSDVDSGVSPNPYPMCQALIGYTYFLASYERPASLLGWMYVLEAVGADLGPVAKSGLMKISDLPLQFVSGHAEADVVHTREMEEVLSALKDPADCASILRAATTSAELYIGMFNELSVDAHTSL